MSTSPHQADAPPPSNPSPTSPPTKQQLLPLPEPSTPDPSPTATTKLSVNGGGVKLDHLGPLVVNKDGSLSRIANWDSMAEIERQNTLRILGKRNMLRREGLKAQAQAHEGK